MPNRTTKLKYVINKSQSSVVSQEIIIIIDYNIIHRKYKLKSDFNLIGTFFLLLDILFFHILKTYQPC